MENNITKKESDMAMKIGVFITKGGNAKTTSSLEMKAMSPPKGNFFDKADIWQKRQMPRLTNTSTITD